MSANQVAWPTGMSDQDPAARDRPLFFNPQGFLVAVLEDADDASDPGVAVAAPASPLHYRSWARHGR